MFKYSADKLPVAIILGLTGLDFLVYFSVESIWLLLGYYLLMMVPKGCIGAWNHHHQHNFTFRSPVLNRLLEQSYSLHTGVTTNLWVLHHVLGHHLNYQDQTRDESRWKRKDGTTMGVIEYSLSVAFTAYYRGYQVGKRYPEKQRTYLFFTAVTFALVGMLFWHRPLQALMVFAVPMLTSLLWTAWVTYDHHSGLESDDPYLSSYNIMNRWFNVLTGNLGYHTAHHNRGGLHWSKLPTLHKSIADKIPEHLYRKSVFDVVLPD